MDPRRTAKMIEQEEYTQRKFEKLKRTLPSQSPRWWKKEFKEYIDDHIEDCLDRKEFITTFPFIDEEQEEQDRINLHGIKRLVAGAVQEWELLQQPKHAAMCAKLDGALVWQGRGYVSPIIMLFHHSSHLYRVNLRKFRQLYGW